MILSSILLLLLSAVLHAITNALMKQSQDKMAFVWWMLGVFCALGLPALFLIPEVEPVGWIIVLISGLLEAIYFFTLTRAYRAGDLSVVYPIARGSAPLFLLCWAVLFLGERPTRIGLLGILTVVGGLYLINLPSLNDWGRPLYGFRSVASRWALLTGLLISWYSALDKLGVRYFSPLVYVYLLSLVCWICLSFQWLIARRRAALVAEIGASKRIASIIAAGILGNVAYLMVLAALRITPVSYVAPVREVSVVMGAWIGTRFMGEQAGSLRIIASALIALGISLIAIGG
jgi:drug/metabolite transporter (DMT)-like permease